jgi:1,2-phenylacetyl-CoA epoxidase catalytic subunit
MDINTLMQLLDNKSVALEAKMQGSIDKGMIDLYEVFSKEWSETQISLYHLKKAVEDIHYYTNDAVRATMIKYMLEEVPDLALYFKTESINKVLTDSIGRAFDRIAEEYFNNKVVNVIDKQE